MHVLGLGGSWSIQREPSHREKVPTCPVVLNPGPSCCEGWYSKKVRIGSFQLILGKVKYIFLILALFIKVAIPVQNSVFMVEKQMRNTFIFQPTKDTFTVLLINLHL